MQHNFTKSNNGNVKPPVKPAEASGQVESTSKEDVRSLASTFTEVHARKDSLVQGEFEEHLADAIGKYFVLLGAELEKKPDYDDKTKINIAAIYTTRVTSKKAWLPLGTELRFKIKDQKPIFDQQELQDIMFGVTPPVVVTFDEISHYHYGLGETLSAKAIHKTNLSAREVMDHE